MLFRQRDNPNKKKSLTLSTTKTKPNNTKIIKKSVKRTDSCNSESKHYKSLIKSTSRIYKRVQRGESKNLAKHIRAKSRMNKELVHDSALSKTLKSINNECFKNTQQVKNKPLRKSGQKSIESAIHIYNKENLDKKEAIKTQGKLSNLHIKLPTSMQ